MTADIIPSGFEILRAGERAKQFVHFAVDTLRIAEHAATLRYPHSTYLALAIRSGDREVQGRRPRLAVADRSGPAADRQDQVSEDKDEWSPKSIHRLQKMQLMGISP